MSKRNDYSMMKMMSEKTFKLLVSKIVPANPYKKMCRLAQPDFIARSPLPWPITFRPLPQGGFENERYIFPLYFPNGGRNTFTTSNR